MEKLIIPENIPAFNLTAFIVPNLPFCYSSNPDDGNAAVGAECWYKMRGFVGDGESVDRLGIDPNDFNITTKSMWVQVWIRGLGEDNLTDHGLPGNTEGNTLYELIKNKPNGWRRDDLLPPHLPEEFLKDAKEGEEKVTYITKYIDGKKTAIAKIVWSFDQTNSRYGNYGKFEETFKSLITRARAFRA